MNAARSVVLAGVASLTGGVTNRHAAWLWKMDSLRQAIEADA